MTICLDEKVRFDCENPVAVKGVGQVPRTCCKPALHAKKKQEFNIYRVENHPLFDPVLSI
jgi:hypothetical protein